jgi:hypothetical protein
LVPAALIGVDLDSLLKQALNTASLNEGFNSSAVGKNTAARLGAILGELAKAGRDKVTLITSPEISSFADWVEQLIAESTGKQGNGILPVVGEPVTQPKYYSDDRLFVYLRLKGDTTFDARVAALEGAGHPVVRLQLTDIYELGGQFFLWYMETAVAGFILGINPFDQPNVESAKILARNMVSNYQERGQLPALDAALEVDGISIYADQPLAITDPQSPRMVLDNFLAYAQPGAYITLQVYIQPTPETDQALLALREQLRDQTHLATTLGYGPRFLHSTGQLHKGDAGGGMFIQLTSDSSPDLPIPDEPTSAGSTISFGVLKGAQALGDRQALLDSGRRVIRLHLGEDSIAGIMKLTLPGD